MHFSKELNMHISTLPTFHALFRTALQWPLRFARTRAVARRLAPAAAHPSSSLERAQILWLDAAVGLEVNCRSGALWLTYDGQQRDIVVEQGQTHRCDAAGRLAIYALERSIVGFDVLAA